jgi:hypothetical protein
MGTFFSPSLQKYWIKRLDEYDVFTLKHQQSRLQNGYKKFIIYTLSQICLGLNMDLGKGYSLKGGRELFSINKYKIISFEHVLEAGFIGSIKRLQM